MNLKLDIIVVVFQEDYLEVCSIYKKNPLGVVSMFVDGMYLNDTYDLNIVIHFEIDLFGDLDINFMVFRDHLNHIFNIQYLNFYIEL